MFNSGYILLQAVYQDKGCTQWTTRNPHLVI